VEHCCNYHFDNDGFNDVAQRGPGDKRIRMESHRAGPLAGIVDASTIELVKTMPIFALKIAWRF
jgi:hypothetical protein